MYTATLMPGAFRLRALHPLLEEDGLCALIYDLERAAVFEVPSELQLYIGAILERGDLDEAVLSWLVREDLLTSESPGGWAERCSAAENLLGLQDPGWNGTALHLHDQFQARIENSDRRELAQIFPLALRQSLGVRNVRLHLDWLRCFPGPKGLEWALGQLRTMAEGRRYDLCCELTLPLGEVTPRVVDLLAGHTLHVRVVPDADRAADWRDQVALHQLIARLGERLTLQIDPGRVRLRDAWEWAQGAGLRHLDMAPPAPGHSAAGRQDLGDYRSDLLAVCDDILGGLAEGRIPCDFLPLTRLVGRLRHSEPRGGDPLDAAVPSVWLYRKCGAPLGALEGAPPMGIAAGSWGALDEGDVEAGGDVAALPCRSCWARWICGHSAYVASSLEERNSQAPFRGGCSRWRVEAEAAVRFYHQLAQTDPIQALRFFEDLPHGAELPLDAREEFDLSRVPC